MTVAHRLQAYIQAVPTTVYQVAKDCGFARGSLEKMLRKGGGLHSDTIAAVLNRYPDLNAEWLLLGSGEMRRGSSSKKGSPPPIRKAIEDVASVPVGNIVVLDTKAAAGWFSNYGSQEFLAGKPRISLAGTQYRGPGMMAIQVAGDSMEPGIMDEDWLVVREVTDRELVRDGRIYVVVTKGGAVAKRLRRALGGEAFILESDNPAYKAYTVGADEGPIVYDVLALLREKVDVQPHSLFQRLLRMEQDLATLRPGKKR